MGCKRVASSSSRAANAPGLKGRSGSLEKVGAGGSADARGAGVLVRITTVESCGSSASTCGGAPLPNHSRASPIAMSQGAYTGVHSRPTGWPFASTGCEVSMLCKNRSTPLKYRYPCSASTFTATTRKVPCCPTDSGPMVSPRGRRILSGRPWPEVTVTYLSLSSPGIVQL